MKIVVTGANGQVGSELGRLGAGSGHELVVLGREGLDITNSGQIAAVMEQHQPQLVINAAAYTAVDRAEEESELAWAINSDGPRLLAQACERVAIPLFHLSTDYVFDGSHSSPYREHDAVAPLGVYGQSKWAGEEAVRGCLNQHLILRTSWVFGPHGHNFVKTILRVAAERSELRVVADQLGSPTSAGGIAAALLTVADRYAAEETLPWGTYHFTGQPFTSWYGFAQEIVKCGRQAGIIDREVKIVPITTAEYPTPARRPANSQLISRLFQEQFGVIADDWQRALEAMVTTLALSSSSS